MKRWDALLAVAGLALFAYAAARIGWGAVATAIVEARFAVLIVMGLSLFRLILQTRSWSIALQSEGINLSRGELMLIRLASQGVGYLSVLGPVASEPMKISLLRKPGGSSAAATLVDTGIYWFTTGMVGISGCLAAVLLLAHHHRHLVRSLEIFGLILAASLFLIARPKPRLSPLVDALGARCPSWVKKGAQIELAIRRFEIEHPSSIRRMFWLDVASQLSVIAEVVAIFWCLKIPMHAGAVLGVEGATRALKTVAGWMPARIGVDESGAAGVFLALGLSPASGLTLALVRRFRDLLAALVGLSWLALSAGLWKSLPTQMPEVAYAREEA
jgi:hypothetical protein